MGFGTRFTQEEVLDQYTRAQVFNHIYAHPGQRYNHLRNGLGLSGNGMLQFHLDVLEKFDFIRRVKIGKGVRYFYSEHPNAVAESIVDGVSSDVSMQNQGLVSKIARATA